MTGVSIIIAKRASRLTMGGQYLPSGHLQLLNQSCLSHNLPDHHSLGWCRDGVETRLGNRQTKPEAIGLGEPEVWRALSLAPVGNGPRGPRGPEGNAY
jgi:hypothetical protein